MRHAKSSWNDHSLSDHARPLNGRGQRSAQALGDWLRTQGYVPDKALVSDAARTVETFERLQIDCPVTVSPALYHAGPAAILSELANCSENTVLVLGHNPGIGDFAQRLVHPAPQHPRFADYPTGATLVADLESETWAEVPTQKAIARDFVIPRDLIED